MCRDSIKGSSQPATALGIPGALVKNVGARPSNKGLVGGYREWMTNSYDKGIVDRNVV